MKSARKFGMLALAVTLSLSVVATGCKTKKDREAEAAERALHEKEAKNKADAEVERVNAEARARDLEKEKERAAEAKEKAKEETAYLAALNNQERRVRIFRAMEGTYTGSYRSRVSSNVGLSVKLTVENLPVGLPPSRETRVSHIVGQTETVSLGIEIAEFVPGASTRIFHCFLPGNKPDMAIGQLRLTCGTGTRQYRLLLSDRIEDHSWSASDRAAMIAAELTEDRIPMLEGMAIEIITAEVTFNGRVSR